MGVPRVKNPPSDWADITNFAWERLKYGDNPRLINQHLGHLGYDKSERTRRDFLNRWLRNVALELWQKNEKEILDFRTVKKRAKRKKR